MQQCWTTNRTDPIFIRPDTSVLRIHDIKPKEKSRGRTAGIEHTVSKVHLLLDRNLQPASDIHSTSLTVGVRVKINLKPLYSDVTR